MKRTTTHQEFPKERSFREMKESGIVPPTTKSNGSNYRRRIDMNPSTITTGPRKILARILAVTALAVLLGSWAYSQEQPPQSGESAAIKTDAGTTGVNTKTYAQVPGSILQVFYRGADDSLYTRWRNPDGTWSGEQHLGGILNGDPFAARVPGTNILQVFYRGADNGLYTRWRNPDGTWSGEQHLGGILTGDPIVAQVP